MNIKYIFTVGCRYLALDTNSGYPYVTENYMDTRIWTSKEDALHYASLFKDPQWKLRELHGLNMSLPLE